MIFLSLFSLAEHTTFRESIVCYTLQAFYKVLLAVFLTFTAGGNDDNFSFLFPPKFNLGRKKVADKNYHRPNRIKKTVRIKTRLKRSSPYGLNIRIMKFLECST